MADTVQPRGGDAAVVRIHGSNRGLALTTDYAALLPGRPAAGGRRGGRRRGATSARSARGRSRSPTASTSAAPRTRWSWASSSALGEGMAEAYRALDFPVVSGNVSFYNETDGQAVLPTPMIPAASG